LRLTIAAEAVVARHTAYSAIDIALKSISRLTAATSVVGNAV